MSDLRLDPTTNDLEIKDFGFGLTTDSVDALKQKLKIKHQLFLGEFYLDVTKGTPYYEKILKKNPDLVEIAAVFKVQILTTPGVKELTEFNVDFDEALRNYILDYTILSTNGDEINVSL
jgi:hypothetical protein